MRSDSLTFLDQAGIDGKNFRDEIDVAHRLGEYHARLGEQLAALAIHHDVEFEDALAHIMPSESVEWMPKMISLEVVGDRSPAWPGPAPAGMARIRRLTTQTVTALVSTSPADKDHDKHRGDQYRA